MLLCERSSLIKGSQLFSKGAKFIGYCLRIPCLLCACQKKLPIFFWGGYLLGHDTPKQRTFPRAKIVIRTYMFSLWMRHNISPKNQKIRSWSWHCKDFWALFGSASTCKRMRKPQPDKRTEETMSMTRRKANLVKHGDLPPKTGKSLDFEVT